MSHLRFVVIALLLGGCGDGENLDPGARKKPSRDTVAIEPDRSPAKQKPDRNQSPESATIAAGEERDDNELKMRFVWCPPGEFMMGSPETEVGVRGEHHDWETQLPVTITRGFWMGKTEVTQAQWKTVMGTSPWKGKDGVIEGENTPATCVSWGLAKVFCGKMDAGDGRGYRLPTEAEWEYACRAGTTSRFSFGDDESKLDEFAWYRENTLDVEMIFAQPVGVKKPNAWGLHDMHGNVWEWCEDSFNDRLPGGIDPVSSNDKIDRVRRGASFAHLAIVCRCAFRDKFPPSPGYGDQGFRVVFSPPP